MGKKEKNDEQKLSNSNFIDSFKNAIEGLIYAITTQSNIKKQLVIAVVVMILSLFYNFTTTEFLCLTFSVVFVIFAEMINTAIETVVDLYTDLYHPKAKIAKDVGAGSVLLMSINSVIVAYFLFLRETDLSKFGESIFNNMVNSPVHLAFVGIMITVIVAITQVAYLRTKNKERSDKARFLPSGQSAISFAILTSIGLNTKSLLIFVLSLILALLVLENRLEDKKKSTAEVIFGSFMGVLIVLLVYGLTVFRI